MKYPDSESKRSKRRTHRKFKNIETSTRKGRRNTYRQAYLQTIGNTTYEAGTKVDRPMTGQDKSFVMTAGGANLYH